MFVGALNAALNAVTSVDGSGFERIRQALEHLFLGALIGDAPADDVDLTSPLQTAALLQRAGQLIAAHAGNYKFDVPVLVRSLGVSTSQLYRAYEGSGQTPAALLRRTRADRARALFDQRATRISGRDLRKIAEQAGFGSVRSMERALLRFPQHRTSTTRNKPEPPEPSLTGLSGD